MVVLKNKASRSIVLAVLMAVGLLAAGLLASVKPAQATFPGDNGRIAFTSNRAPASSYQIYSVASTGREVDLSPVTTQLAGYDTDPAYSPDGNEIAFARNTGGNLDIWTISSTGAANANRITDSAANDSNPTWSPDGKRIAFTSNRAPASSYQIYSVASTGREVDLSPVTTQLAGYDTDPAYSPDGNKIAFARNTGGKYDIWTISSTGAANANQITDNPANDQSPGYSPDGTRIAFTSNRVSATSYQIYSVASTGREVDLSPVTTQLEGSDESPVYSPDGNKIAFQRTGGPVAGANADIWTISSTGGTNANQITDNPANDFAPTWQSLPKATPPPPGNPPGNNSAPTITGFRPAPNSKIQNRNPLISATVRDAEDNLSATDIKLFVDGNPIAAADFSYDPATDKLSYQSKQLSRGGHTVRVVATDTKGSSTQETWGFRVRRNAP